MRANTIISPKHLNSTHAFKDLEHDVGHPIRYTFNSIKPSLKKA